MLEKTDRKTESKVFKRSKLERDEEWVLARRLRRIRIKTAGNEKDRRKV